MPGGVASWGGLGLKEGQGEEKWGEVKGVGCPQRKRDEGRRQVREKEEEERMGEEYKQCD